jgi:predicted dehydrogenase
MHLTKENEMREKVQVKLGLIGIGNIGAIHLDVLGSPGQKYFALAAVSDLKSQNIEGANYYQDYKELLQNPDVVAVSINTPPVMHYQMVTDALNAGKHVLVEKPPALTVAQCEEMAKLAKEKNKVLFMAFHARYHPEVDIAKEELLNKQVTEINITYGECVLNYHDSEGWIFDPKIVGGGVLMDSGINALSIVTKVMPDIRWNVTGAGFDKPSGFRVETKADIKFSFGKIGKGTLSMDWMQKGPEKRQVGFRTDVDEYLIDIVKNQFLKNGAVIGEKKNDSQLVDQKSEYAGIYGDFANHLSSHTSLISTRELEFIEQAYKL